MLLKGSWYGKFTVLSVFLHSDQLMNCRMVFWGLVVFGLFLTHCGRMTPYGDLEVGPIWSQVMACCLTAPSHYLNQCWLIISEIQWQSPKNNFTRDASAITYWNQLENHLKIVFKSPMGQWVTFMFSRNRLTWRHHDIENTFRAFHATGGLWKWCIFHRYDLRWDIKMIAINSLCTTCTTLWASVNLINACFEADILISLEV